MAKSMPPPGPVPPPSYLGADTCAECWEPFEDWFFDRWFHRRKWGHTPTTRYHKPSAAERHASNVKAAQRYKERNSTDG